jgi:hypothetical protein
MTGRLAEKLFGGEAGSTSVSSQCFSDVRKTLQVTLILFQGYIAEKHRAN